MSLLREYGQFAACGDADDLPMHGWSVDVHRRLDRGRRSGCSDGVSQLDGQTPSGTPCEPVIEALLERKSAGKTACVLGSGWLVGVVAIWGLQRFVWHSTTVIILPIFGLLALYLAVAGGVQWATGRGGLKSRQTGLSTAQTIVVQAALFVALGFMMWFQGRR